jgi:hypothetical protein
VTMRITALTLSAVVFATAACYTGPSATSYYGVTDGGGVKATFHLRHGTTKGELLEVRDSALLLLDGCKVNLVPFAAIRESRFSGINPEYVGGIPTPTARAELATLSRFPAGAPKEVIDHYLQCASMTAPAVLGATASLPNATRATESAILRARDDSGDAFLARARVAVQRYASLDSAIAAGYRQLGGDLPSLGEHWIHPGLVMSGGIDPSRPSVLIYIRTASGPTLAGAAWTKVLGPGEPYPSRPAGPDAWHEHNGSVADETLPMMHHHGAMSSAEPTRVAILHAWIGIENPSGVWVADNWALPFARAGLHADGASVAAARAMSLTAPGAVPYYERVIESAAGTDSAVLGRARTLIERSAEEATTVRRGSLDHLSEAQLAQLTDLWTRLWAEVTNGPPSGRDEQLRRLAVAMQ